MKRAILLMAGSLVAAFSFATPASAAPFIFCSTGGGAINLVTQGCISGTANGYPNGGDAFYSNAGGGDPEAKVEQAILQATGVAVDITKYGKSDEDPALFSFSATPTTVQSGTWDVLDNSVLIKYITVKAANSFALYEIAGAGANMGSWTTLGILNNGGQQPNTSHITFWLSDAAVPEPASWAMMLGGFGVIGASMRRRQRAVITYA